MNVDINWLAVVLAALSSMVVGSLWYMPATFGTAWQKYTGVDIKKMRGDSNAAKMAWMYGSVYVASLVTAYILAHVSFIANRFFGNSFLTDSLWTGAWLWLGFTAARIYTHDTFEGRRKKLTVLTSAHELVTILVMALIIGLMKP